jgi:hypothetical protein
MTNVTETAPPTRHEAVQATVESLAARARRLSGGRGDLAAVCFERALGEWVTLALSAQCRGAAGLAGLGEACWAAAPASCARLDDDVSHDYVVQLAYRRLERGWSWLTVRAEDNWPTPCADQA